MAYNLQRTATTLVSGKNILASEHFQFAEAGVTLKGGVAYPIGTLIARNKAGVPTVAGKWEVFANLNIANYDDFGVLNTDVASNTADSIVGEVIIRGSVYEAKLPVNADIAIFKGKATMIRFVTQP